MTEHKLDFRLRHMDNRAELSTLTQRKYLVGCLLLLFHPKGDFTVHYQNTHTKVVLLM